MTCAVRRRRHCPRRGEWRAKQRCTATAATMPGSPLTQHDPRRRATPAEGERLVDDLQCAERAVAIGLPASTDKEVMGHACAPSADEPGGHYDRMAQ